ncbi:pilus assembly FimT family protein [Stutzerimonas kunmingensis]|uniref:pilus assembly FimT family protein n=1 Tax=Stutzerimonas kunmingensis TaxID=1211807 RepID=UPI0028996151|nr:type II secretion system protein [Stutzerimonas kunmingensis]
MRGFTLVELIITIMLIGILAAVVGPRFFDRQIFDQRLFYEETLAAVRYAQKYALASGCRVQVTVNNGGFVLNRAESCQSGSFTCGAGCSVPGPDGENTYTGTKPAGVSVSPNPFVVQFGSLGQPLGGAASVSVDGFQLNVHATTGFVEAVR